MLAENSAASCLHIALFGQESLGLTHETVQLIVVNPVTGAFEVHQAGVLKVPNTAVDHGVGRP